MESLNTSKQWLWRIYELVAVYINDPTDANEVQLKAYINAYRVFVGQEEQQASTNIVFNPVNGVSGLQIDNLLD